MSDDFLAWPELLSLHRDLIKAKVIDARVSDGTILDLIDSTPGKYVEAAALLTFLTERDALRQKVASYSQTGLNGAAMHLANMTRDPPLIDVYVRGGFRKGDVNDPEAQATLQEIQAILADPFLAGRTIGVVTLLGTDQAAHIHKLVTTHISPMDVVTRQIAVGPPPVFQGRERDIMLVSMVLAPGDHSAQNRADQNQRFNVALSRARDREYLFRSVDHTAFAEDTLNGRLIRHFREPFRQDARSSKLLRERCESDFERDMFDELVKRGYRIEPQVGCGGFRIDFVIEGREGRRIAVECDRDGFHGPGQWSEDMARQRVLERAGWTFWRCFASNFRRRRAAVLEDLFITMANLGIEPLGSECVDNTVWGLLEGG